MPTISVKDYYCPTCGAESRHSTNHTEEIYCGCQRCGASVLYCKEAVKENPDSKCVLVCYTFHLLDMEQGLAYERLCDFLKERGYKKFNVSSTFSYREALKQFHGKHVGVYNKAQFEGQYVTDIGRLHDWHEAVIPNKTIKTGYYLEWEDNDNEND